MTATLHHLGGSGEPGLEPLLQLTESDMISVNAVILERMQSIVWMIAEVGGKLFAVGGKLAQWMKPKTRRGSGIGSDALAGWAC